MVEAMHKLPGESFADVINCVTTCALVGEPSTEHYPEAALTGMAGKYNHAWQLRSE